MVKKQEATKAVSLRSARKNLNLHGLVLKNCTRMMPEQFVLSANKEIETVYYG